MDEPIRFDAEVRQIKSMADRSFNLVLNIPEYNIEQSQQLMKMLLEQVAVAIISVGEDNNTYTLKKG